MSKDLNRDELLQQLGNAIHLRSAQDQVLWSIFGVFWAANAILLVALFPQGHFPTYPIGFIISVVGMLFSLVWYKIQGRALGHIDRHENLMEILEKKLVELDMPQEYAVSAKINKDNKCSFKSIPARKLMPICSQVVAILWAIGALIFLILFIVKLVCSCSIV